VERSCYIHVDCLRRCNEEENTERTVTQEIGHQANTGLFTKKEVSEMIRFIVGLVIVLGAVGGMDEPENSLLVLMGIAGVGLALMYFGSEKMKQL
jgi:uncharacterized membrane protein